MWHIYCILLFSATVSAKTGADYKEDFTKNVMKCTTTNPVDMADLIELQKLVVPKKKEVKCLLACAYRADGTLSDKGLYNIKHSYKMADLMKSTSEESAKNALKMGELCLKANDVAVSDGEKGCDRAALIFKIITENAPKLGFKV